MTTADFATFLRYKTKNDSTTLPDSELVLIANVVKNIIADRIISRKEDVFGVPEYADLTAGQREYPMPSTNTKVRGVEAKLDGTNWIKLLPFDLSKFTRATDEASIILQYANSQGNAYYDLFRNSLWLYTGTIITVSQGLKLWGIDYPADITDLSSTDDLSEDPTTTTSGIPRAFHELWVAKCSIMWKESQSPPVGLSPSELGWEVLMGRKLTEVYPIDDATDIIGHLPDASQKGNNGFNY